MTILRTIVGGLIGIIGVWCVALGVLLMCFALWLYPNGTLGAVLGCLAEGVDQENLEKRRAAFTEADPPEPPE